LESYVIYGPPGTGKSTEIVRRLKEYIKKGEYPARKIGMCSYTKAAAETLAKKADIKSKFIGTIHSLAFSAAGCIVEQIIDNKKFKDFQDKTGIVFSAVSSDGEDVELCDGDMYMRLYNYAKTQLIDDVISVYGRKESPGTRAGFQYFVNAYEAWKRETGYIDFDDMLQLAMHSDVPDVDVLFIDEAQDLSPLQWALVTYWASSIEHVHVAGDDDQAIYVWAGADPTGMFKFEKNTGAKRCILDQSFRVPGKVHTKAMTMIKSVSDRVEKEYKPRLEAGVILYYSCIEEVYDIVHGDDILVLYRNHNLRRDVEDLLFNTGVPYLLENGGSGACQNKTWRLLKLFIRLQTSDMDEVVLSKSENKLLLKGLMHPYSKQVEKFDMSVFKRNWEEVLDMSYMEKCYYKSLEKISPSFDITPTVRLGTIHGAKGKEADRVILFNGMGDQAAEGYYSGDTDSENRVFYVGITRAKERLDIVMCDNGFPGL